jgi:hypothetical protein
VIEDTGDQASDQSKESIQQFFTSCGTLSLQIAAKTTELLLNQACIHRLSPDRSLSDKLLPDSTSVPELRTLRTDITDLFTTDVPSCYGSGEFYRIIIDTRAAKRSTAGIS